jgi:hypothetical protein
MFDLTNPSNDGTTYSNPYASTVYRPFPSTPSSSSFLFNLPNSIDDQQQQQRLTDFSSYPTQDLM